ncbi:hypothetical protein [Streptomyces sp. NPDC020965]|uniref:SCO2583 family membrane protein n=1 Tax=Streptomyces sp. NPDC020965 TaxID=3365105 RepID=UPI00379D62A1
MSGRRDPPEGPPEGSPGGGEDEYRSVVFDESFVRAARLQEFSARERMGEPARAVRNLPGWNPRTGPRAALALLLLVALAFGTAIYLGVRNPYRPPSPRSVDAPRITVIPLVPQGPVPGGTPDELYAHSPAAHFRIGAAGIALPAVRRTKNFSESQVMNALTTAKDYLVASSLDPEVLTGGTVRPVRVLLDPDQLEQFDRGMAAPAADGHHTVTGWLIRYDPAQIALAHPEVRVRGTLSVTEAGPHALKVTSDHTFAYALRPAAPRSPASADRTGGTDGPVGVDTAGHPGQASLFTVRRELSFRLDREDLHQHRVELLTSYVQAGPQSCSDRTTGTLRPLLAGRHATAGIPPGTNPYSMGDATTALCGSLAPGAQPNLQAPRKP